MIIGMIVLLGVGILFLVLGTVIRKKQKISLIHEYHTRNVKKEDIAAYTKLMGLAMIAIGAGCVLTGIIALGFEKPLGWLALPIGFIIGFALILKAQKKYNGGKMIS